ncbi:hypothetical protein RFI_07730 [Reticulomyxa filosa]|uniref:Sulfotransferase domain-containing protein n=1 Tax=Reticulomyxa filosa TaxID=46433 RepID=X6NVV4_RETFI|nr:hypothetical protein RFI_07730 [Reticulomyxa filosa]|eukprot:ETO29387.1 hypothetical protein RFI_07730 [Reticulomyxa filosa]
MKAIFKFYYNYVRQYSVVIRKNQLLCVNTINASKMKKRSIWTFLQKTIWTTASIFAISYWVLHHNLVEFTNQQFNSPLADFQKMNNQFSPFHPFNIPASTDSQPTGHMKHKGKVDQNSNIKCKYKGKLFLIGMFKTGTTSLTRAVTRLGYPCASQKLNQQETLHSCHYNALTEYLQDPNTLYFTFYDDPSPLLENSKLLFLLKNFSANSYLFRDGNERKHNCTPWLFLYPLIDQWYPNSKYILTVRDSTWKVVNSDVGMRCRQYNQKMFGINKCREVWNTSSSVKIFEQTFIENVALYGKEWMLATAKRYEIHNQNVIRYFSSRNRLKDLLVINLDLEARPWLRIANFFGVQTE